MTFLQAAREAIKKGETLVWDGGPGPVAPQRMPRLCPSCGRSIAVRGKCLTCKRNEGKRLKEFGVTLTRRETQKRQRARRVRHENLVKKRGYGEKITIERFAI